MFNGEELNFSVNKKLKFICPQSSTSNFLECEKSSKCFFHICTVIMVIDFVNDDRILHILRV